MTTPALLIDDPRANDVYDLRATLSGWRDGLAGVVVPLGSAESGPLPALANNDSDTTRALKTAPVRYRVEAGGVAVREFDVAAGPEIVRTLGSSLVIVGFVSAATFPLFVALSQHPMTRAFLRVGVTGVRMDQSYNLARKLFVDSCIAYHEHTRTLERVLCRRLDLMLRAHAERASAA